MTNLMREINVIFPLHFPTPKFVLKVKEDNQSCIAMTNNPKFTPRTKHIAIKYHHFRKHVSDKTIAIFPISTADQLADIFYETSRSNCFYKATSTDYGLVGFILQALITRECEDKGILAF